MESETNHSSQAKLPEGDRQKESQAKNDTEPLAGKKNEDEQAALRIAYQEVCNSYHAIDDVRIGLLGRLPLISGAGIAVLLNTEVLGLEPTFYVLIGLFGFVVSFGLLLYEVRGVQQCAFLIALGSELERSLFIEKWGQFTKRPEELLGIGKTSAARLIYPIVLAAWIYVIFFYYLYPWSPAAAFRGGTLAALCVAIVSFIAIADTTKRYRLIYKPESERETGDSGKD